MHVNRPVKNARERYAEAVLSRPSARKRGRHRRRPSRKPPFVVSSARARTALSRNGRFGSRASAAHDKEIPLLSRGYGRETTQCNRHFYPRIIAANNNKKKKI